MPVPENPRIYHITHVRNLDSIVQDGILSDRQIVSQNIDPTTIGLSTIKTRRLEDLEVKCFPGKKVGEFVPFNFCPRSVMLYVIYRGNNPRLDYQDGQENILHLEAELYRVIDWAEEQQTAWAFSLQNAGAQYAEFRRSKDALAEINWEAVEGADFRNGSVKEAKQAEFLIDSWFPVCLVSRIGVRTQEVANVASRIVGPDGPEVVVRPEWYY